MQVFHKPEDAQGDGLSFSLWKNFPTQEILVFKDRNVGYGFIEDFDEVCPYQAAGAGPATVGQWSMLTSLTSTIAARVVAGQLGVVSLIPTTTVDLVSAIQAGGSAAGPSIQIPFSLALTTPRELIFEARVKTSSVAATGSTFFVGLAGAASQAAVDTLYTTGTHVPKGIQYCGFSRQAGSEGAAAGTGYELPTKVSLITSLSALSWSAASCGTVAAATWTKLGFRLNPTLKTMSVWQDGAQVATVGTTITGSATKWPTAGLHVLLLNKLGAGVAGYLDIDWVACAQLGPVPT